MVLFAARQEDQQADADEKDDAAHDNPQTAERFDHQNQLTANLKNGEKPDNQRRPTREGARKRDAMAIRAAIQRWPRVVEQRNGRRTPSLATFDSHLGIIIAIAQFYTPNCRFMPNPTPLARDADDRLLKRARHLSSCWPPTERVQRCSRHNIVTKIIFAPDDSGDVATYCVKAANMAVRW